MKGRVYLPASVQIENRYTSPNLNLTQTVILVLTLTLYDFNPNAKF